MQFLLFLQPPSACNPHDLLNYLLEQSAEVLAGVEHLRHRHHCLAGKLLLQAPANLHGKRRLPEPREPHDAEHLETHVGLIVTRQPLRLHQIGQMLHLVVDAHQFARAERMRGGGHRRRSWDEPHGAGQCLAVDIVTNAALSDGEGTGEKLPDVAGEAVPGANRDEPAPAVAERSGARRGVADAEQGEVDAVLGVVGELAHLIHPLPDEVVHGALLHLGEPAEDGVHDGHLVLQTIDLAADAAEQPEFRCHQLPKPRHKATCVARRRTLHSRKVKRALPIRRLIQSLGSGCSAKRVIYLC
ncbi:hypothetical protein DAI22_07g063700 [Oryza sativa Japonica Group]|nr:hypothetical protein DAI22_07g063700 [Oryza sativa Japonica Group]